MTETLTHPDIAAAEQTCIACPDQWEGRFTNGRHFYFRLRHGWASLAIGSTPEAIAGYQHVRTRYEPYPDCGAFENSDDRARVFAELVTAWPTHRVLPRL